MVTISGTLTNGASKAITDCTIVLKAKKTTSSVLVKTEAYEVSETGAYNMNVQPGLYDVVLLENGFPPKSIGTIEVKSNSKAGTLNDFLILPITGSVVSSELLDQLIDERIQAQQAATNAKASETNAKNSASSAASTLSGAVKKSGDTMVGDLKIQKDGAALHLLNKSNNGMMIRSETSGNVSFNLSTDGVNEVKWFYDKTSNRLLFVNLTDVLIDYRPVLKMGDAGLNSTALTLLDDFKTLSNKSGFYLAMGAKTPSPTPNCPTDTNNSRLTVNVRSDGSVTHYEVIETSHGAPIKWIGECYHNGSELVLYWTKAITTANIRDYQPAASVGVGQIWRDLTSSRALNTVYTNTTGKPIFLSILKIGDNNSTTNIFVDGIRVGVLSMQDIYSQSKQAGVIVPSGSTYKLTGSLAGITWTELR